MRGEAATENASNESGNKNNRRNIDKGKGSDACEKVIHAKQQLS